MIATRTESRLAKRSASRKGSCHLTHGADSYDKKGFTRVSRQYAKAEIARQLEEEIAADEQEALAALEARYAELEREWIEYDNAIAEDRRYQAYVECFERSHAYN